MESGNAPPLLDMKRPGVYAKNIGANRSAYIDRPIAGAGPDDVFTEAFIVIDTVYPVANFYTVGSRTAYGHVFRLFLGD